MINGGPINSGPINALGDQPGTLSAALVLNAVVVEGYAFDSIGNVGNLVLQKAVVYGETGAHGSLVIGKPAVAGTATAVEILTAALTIAKAVVAGEMSAQETMDGALTIAAAQVYGETGAQGGLTIGRVGVSGAMTAEEYLSAALMLANAVVAGEMTAPETMTGHLVLNPVEAQWTYGALTIGNPIVAGEMSAQDALEAIAYALNLVNNAMTPYTDFPYQHIVRFKGHTYGFDASGGYLLEGDDDNGTDIDASFTLPDWDYGADNLKNVPYVYVGTKCENIQVTAIVDEDIYSPMIEVAFPLGTNRNKRAKFGRGAKGVFWRHSFSNIDGGALDIDDITIQPDLKRSRI